MLPAVERADYAEFGKAIYQFGHMAGSCFSAAQGGPFADTEIGRTVQLIRELGIPGAGQSSWGPTVFAMTAGEGEAEVLVEALRRRGYGSEYEISVARPNNSGALIESF
jgi:predicted sugar kinase